MWNRKDEARRATIVDEAMRHVGYRAQPQRRSAFQLKPYLGQPWNGTFVDRVLHDTFGDFAEVRFISTVAALGYYAARNRVYRKPRAGDVVFFNFSSDPQQPFEQPHIGIVTGLRGDGAFETVEAEANPGHAQGSRLPDGVFERVRYPTDILGVVRPTARTVNGVDGDGEDSNLVRMSYFESNPSTKSKAVETVQRALNRVRPAFTFNRGKKDGVFKSAFAAYARETGTVENRGELTYGPLSTLASETGVFHID